MFNVDKRILFAHHLDMSEHALGVDALWEEFDALPEPELFDFYASDSEEG